MDDVVLRRAEGLLAESFGNDVVVLDVAANRAHALDADAAAVWTACDGRRAAGELASASGLSDAALQSALSQLLDAGLLTETGGGISRRRLLQVGGAAVAGTAVLSIPLPAAAAAISYCKTPKLLTKGSLLSLAPGGGGSYMTHAVASPSASVQDPVYMALSSTFSSLTPQQNTNATFRVVNGLSNASLVSFQSISNSACYLRHYNFRFFIAQVEGDFGNGAGLPFNQDATFTPITCGTTGTAFQSVNYPASYMDRSLTGFYDELGDYHAPSISGVFLEPHANLSTTTTSVVWSVSAGLASA